MLFDQGRCTRSLRCGLRQRCVDFVANRRGHIVERRAEKRGFSETRPAIPADAAIPFPALGLTKASRLRRRLVLTLVVTARRSFRTASLKPKRMLAVMVPLLCSIRKSDVDISGAVRLVGARPPILPCCKVRWRPIPSRVILRTSPELIAPGRVSSHFNNCWSPTRYAVIIQPPRELRRRLTATPRSGTRRWERPCGIAESEILSSHSYPFANMRLSGHHQSPSQPLRYDRAHGSAAPRVRCRPGRGLPEVLHSPRYTV